MAGLALFINEIIKEVSLAHTIGSVQLSMGGGITR